MNFKIIKHVVSYSKRIFKNWRVRYILSTNGTMLSGEIGDYLVKENFRVQVSLDGPKEIHDANRIFPGGAGSQQLVEDNLSRIKAKNKDYYYDKINVISVWPKDQSPKAIYNYFTSHDLYGQIGLRASSIKPHNYRDYREYPEDDNVRNEQAEIIKRIENKILAKEELKPYEVGYYVVKIKNFENRLAQRKYSPLYMSCMIPSRLFIDTDGRFHVCNLVNQSFAIGDVYRGFDFEIMAELIHLNIDVQNSSCSNCEIAFLCPRCHMHFMEKGRYEINREYCSVQKRVIKNTLNYYVDAKLRGIL